MFMGVLIQTLFFHRKNNFFSCVFGFNLPILLKIINYKNLKLDEILKKNSR